jgi:hypothetical protein
MSLGQALLPSGLLMAAFLHAQNPITYDELPQFKSGIVRRDGAIIWGRGNIEAQFGKLLFRAGEGKIDLDKGRIELWQHVAVTLPGRSDHNLIRCGDGPVILTREPLSLTADEVTATSGLLSAEGHVVVQQSTTIAHSDRAYIYLGIGDGEIVGSVNVQRDDKPLRTRASRYRMPPDVIK